MADATCFNRRGRWGCFNRRGRWGCFNRRGRWGCFNRRKRWSAAVLTAVLAGGILCHIPAAAQEKEQQAPKRKTKRVKALSLVAQGYVLRVTRIMERASGYSDEAAQLGQAAAEAGKAIPKLREELDGLADNPELNEKQRLKRREKILKEIAQGEELIRTAPAKIEKLQQDALDTFAKAVPVLDDMKGRGDKLQSQDRAAMWNYYGHVYAILERFAEALDAYKQLLTEEDAPDDLKLQAMYVAAQLSILLEEYVQGVEYLEGWFKFATELGRRIRPSNHFLLAQAYFHLGRYDEVLQRLDIAISIARSENALPREVWLRLQVATLFEKEQFEEAKPSLELLVLLYPKREYWLQLQGIYGRLEQREDQLSALHLAWQQKLLENESEFLALAQQLQANEDPYEAALVLSEGLELEIVERDYDNLRMLGDTWHRAGETEQALEIYLEAADLSETGEIHYRLALIFNLENRIEESLQQSRIAVEKGDMVQIIEARILVAQNLLDLGEREEALEIFETLAEEGYENRVKNWIAHTRVQVEAINRMRSSIEAYRKQEERIISGLRDYDEL